MTFLVPLFETIGSILWTRGGLMAVAFALGWGYSALKCDFRVNSTIERLKAQQKAAVDVARAEERAAAAEIAQAATERAAEDQKAIADRDAKIDNFSRQEKAREPKNGQCVADRAFVGVVRDVSKARPAPRHR